MEWIWRCFLLRWMCVVFLFVLPIVTWLIDVNWWVGAERTSTWFHKLPSCFPVWEQTRKIKGNIFVMKVDESCIHKCVVKSRFLFGMTIIMEFWPLTIVVSCSKSWSFATKSCLTVRRRTFYTWQRVLEMRTADCISDSNTTCDDVQLFFIHLKLKSAHVWLQLFLYYVFHFQTSSIPKNEYIRSDPWSQRWPGSFFGPTNLSAFKWQKPISQISQQQGRCWWLIIFFVDFIDPFLVGFPVDKHL